MIATEKIDALALAADGTLLAVSGYSDEELTWIDDHYDIVRERLLGQRDDVGFYRCLPAAVLRIIEKSEWSVLDLETTALSKYDKPCRVTKSTKIAGKPYAAYLGRHQQTSVDTRPRIRIAAINVDGYGAFAFDLDYLTAEERKALFVAAIEGKGVVGHNLGFDLSNVFNEVVARPKWILDTMILARQVRPALLLRLNFAAAQADNKGMIMARNLLQRKRGKISASMEYVAACLGLGVVDKSCQKPPNWCVSELSADHYEYVVGDIEMPLKILKVLFRTESMDNVLQTIDKEHLWYRDYAAATVHLAEAHARGIAFDSEGANAMVGEYEAELLVVADELRVFPELAPHADDIANPRKNETDAIRQGLVEHAIAHGIEFPKTATGKISTDAKAVKMSDVPNLPAWRPYTRTKAIKRCITQLKDYIRAASTDGRLHPLISFTTAAGRTSCSKPNVQNVPRNPRFRHLFKAQAGNVILSADYAAIELRIVSMLAERAINATREMLKSAREYDEWGFFTRSCWEGLSSQSTLKAPSDTPPEPADADEYKKTLPGLRIAYLAQRVLRRKEQEFSRIFRLNLDPHLVTGLDLARRTGKVSFDGSATDYVASLTSAEQEKLKKTLEAERQQAKAVNFGLTYGMKAPGLHEYGITNYALLWTPEEAAAAREAWFEIYPEVEFWHVYTKYVEGAAKREPNQLRLWDKYENHLSTPKWAARIITPRTLSRRPFALLNDIRQALSYQGQGSGADILVRAMSHLPEELVKMLMMPVHDELVFEVPAERAEELKHQLLTAMEEAGAEILGSTMPVKVEAKIAPHWEK
jgi:DNA polymerase-1